MSTGGLLSAAGGPGSLLLHSQRFRVRQEGPGGGEGGDAQGCSKSEEVGEGVLCVRARCWDSIMYLYLSTGILFYVACTAGGHKSPQLVRKTHNMICMQAFEQKSKSPQSRWAFVPAYFLTFTFFTLTNFNIKFLIYLHN